MATAKPRARANGSARSSHRTNGHVEAAPPPAPAGPQIERRYEWVPIDEEHYPGFLIRLWLNHPFELYRDVYRGTDPKNADRAALALTQIAPEHNHWRDYDGREYSPANTTAFWDELPVELFRVVLFAIDEGPNLLPKALRATRLASASFSTPTGSRGARPA